MNYIKQLQEEVAAKSRALTAIQNDITSMMQALNGPKFTGVNSDGSRKDWIATGDVANWLIELRRETIQSPARGPA